MIIDNYFAALFTQSVAIGELNPPGEADYKGYQRVQFCSVNGESIENITFDKAQESSCDSITHLAAMDHQGRVMFVMQISHIKNYD